MPKVISEETKELFKRYAQLNPENPRVAIATVVVQTPLYRRTASQVAAGVLESVFCESGRCDASRADRFAVPQRAETVAQTAPLR